MTRARGHALQHATASVFAAAGWVHAESTPNGRPGRDILGIPGIYVEIKTSFAGTSPGAVVQDTACKAGGDLPLIWYWPPGVGARRPDLAVVMMPPAAALRLLREAGYGPELITRKDLP